METLGHLVNVILIEVIVGGRADSNILKVRILGWRFVGIWGRPAVLWWGVWSIGDDLVIFGRWQP